MDETQLEAFERLIRAKKRFLIPTTMFLFIFYFLLPVTIVCFPEVMNHPVLFGVTPAWAFAFAQFAMVWAFGGIYYIKSKTFDRMAGQVDKEGRSS